MRESDAIPGGERPSPAALSFEALETVPGRWMFTVEVWSIGRGVAAALCGKVEVAPKRPGVRLLRLPWSAKTIVVVVLSW